jgi:hypothetical protein
MADQVLALPTPRARELAVEINALCLARDCATGSEGAVAYGRIDSLICERQDELTGICRQAQLHATGSARA